MDSTILRLCKEGNFEDVYSRYQRIRTYSVGEEVYREKNSIRESSSYPFKRRFEEKAVIVDKTEV